MEIELLEIAGFRSALIALRLPYGLEPRSNTFSELKFDSEKEEFLCETGGFIEPKDLKLMNTLIKRGDEHAKVLRGILAYTKITAPIYWWWDLETYTVGHQRLLSGSTMNKECKGLTGEELQKVKGEISFGREITKIDYFSYQTLRRIYYQRRTHRLPEFEQFCDWIETLPFAQELILVEPYSKSSEV